MSVTLVTGATGLVGSHVTRRLLERGDAVRVTVRERSKRDNLAPFADDLEMVTLRHPRPPRRAQGACATSTASSTSPATRTCARRTTRSTRSTSTAPASCSRRRCAPGVERVTFTSSVAAIGPAPRGSTADETQVFRAGRFGLPYVNSKHEAENEALRISAHGLPVVIVNPCHVFGRGDLYRSSTEVVRRFLRREIPVYVDGAVNIVDADDVARGILLADERGGVGERYILGNRNFTLDRLFADLGRLSGVEPPAVKLPLPAALALARAAEAMPGKPVVDRGRGPHGLAVVDLPLHEGQARARLEALAPRGHAGRDDRLVPRARRPRLAARHAPAAGAAPRRLRRAPRRGPDRPAQQQ